MEIVCNCHKKNNGKNKVGEGERVVKVKVVVEVVTVVKSLCGGNGGCCCYHSLHNLAWLAYISSPLLCCEAVFFLAAWKLVSLINRSW